jgi:hypothetical protein
MRHESCDDRNRSSWIYNRNKKEKRANRGRGRMYVLKTFGTEFDFN